VTDAGRRANAARGGSRRRYAAHGKSAHGGAGGKAGKARKRGWRKFVSFKAFFLYFLGFTCLGVIGVGVVYARTEIPEPNDFALSETTIVYYSDGETELGRFNAENRESVDISQIPEHVRNAVLAAEDRRFYSNPGFDPAGIARAGLNFIRSGGEIDGGGSGITQQYVKNYYLTQDQSWDRKLNELFVSIKIDQQLDKDDILASYLNTIWYGRDGLYGVQTASKSYFGKPVSETTLEEGIALATILRSPHRYDPTLGPENTERFEARFQFVLDGMLAMGTVDPQEAGEAEPPEVKPRQDQNRLGGPNGYLLQQVERELRNAGIDEAEIRTGGLRVVTTFDKDAQDAAVRAVEEERPTESADGVRIGLAAVRPEDGGVVAMYGGPDAVEQSFNDALDGKQQAGSAFKPFTLIAALEEGISLESRYWGNSPFDPPEIGPPVNNQNDADYGEDVDLIESMERSINTAFVDLTMQMGPSKVVDALIRAGVPENAEDLNNDARVTLGIGKVSTVEMAEIYATLAAGGRQTDWYTVRRVTDRGGNVVHEVEPEPKTVFDAAVVADTTYALTQVVDGENGTGHVARELGRPSAGKTGTHQDLTAWYAGYTPQLAAAVSFIRGEGEAGGTESLRGIDGESSFPGGRYPARIWTAFMSAVLEDEEVLEADRELVTCRWCGSSDTISEDGGAGSGETA
jgi:membrane peptidoglycan carboxypeptidase